MFCCVCECIVIVMSVSPALSESPGSVGGNPPESKEVVYSQFQFVVVFEQAEINNFTIAQLLEDVKSDQKEAKSMFFTRVRQNRFRPDGEDLLSTKYIVQVLDHASLDIVYEKVLRRSRSRRDQTPEKAAKRRTIKEVAIEMQIYKGVVPTVKKFRPEFSESEEDGSQEEEGSDNEEGEDGESPQPKLRSKSQNKSPGKLKIVGAKNASQANGKKLRRTTQGDEEDNLNTSKISKGKTGKVVVPVFKKGIINPKVETIDICQQLESRSTVPNFECSTRTSNRELLRAATIGSKDLLVKLMSSHMKLSSLNPQWGVDNKKTPLKILIDNGHIDLIIQMVEVMGGRSEKIQPRLTHDNEVAIKKIDTGYNDKHAYGVATRKVALSRGGRQGNNAFVEDLGSSGRGSFDEYHQVYFLSSPATNVEHVQKFLGYMPSFENQFIAKIPKILLHGSRDVANFLLARAFKNEGYGLNEYFTKCLMSTDVKDIEEIKKQSVTKKAFGIDNITPLHCACLNPNGEILKHLLNLNPEYHLIDNQMRKLVHYAACCKSIEPLKVLCEFNLDTREGDAQKLSPLMYACKYGSLSVVQFLLQENRSTPLYKDKTSRNALHIAAENGHLDIVKALLESGHLKQSMPGPDRLTILHIAAARDYFPIVQYLVQERKMRPVQKDKMKRTPLLLAAKNGNLKIASFLLQKGAEFDAPDSSGNTPLHYACAYGYPEMIDILVQAGADVNADNSWKLSPTAVALLKSYFCCLRKMLSYPNTNVNCVDDEGRTLVSNAVKTVSRETYNHVSFLLQEKNADPNIPDTAGMVAFDYLIAHNVTNLAARLITPDMSLAEQEAAKAEFKSLYKKFLRLFVEHGAQINRLANDGLSPLLRAVKFRNSEAMNFLLDEPTIQLEVASNKDGCTLLHYLGDFVGSEDFFELSHRLLGKLNSPALLNKYNFQGRTPLHNIFEKFVEQQPYFKAKFYAHLEKELREEKKRGVESLLPQMQQNMQNWLGKNAQTVSQPSASNSSFGQRKAANKIVAEDEESDGEESEDEDQEDDDEEEEPKRGRSFFSKKRSKNRKSFLGGSTTQQASSALGGSGGSFFGGGMQISTNMIPQPSTFGGFGSNYQHNGGFGIRPPGGFHANTNLASIHITEAERVQMDSEASKLAQRHTEEFFVFLEGLIKKGADPQLLVKNPSNKKTDEEEVETDDSNPFDYFIKFVDRIQNAIRKKINIPEEEKPHSTVGYSLVHLAANSTELSVYQFLLDRMDIPLNQRSVYGETEIQRLIDCCGGSDRSVAVLQFLIKKGADPSLADYYGVTPLLKSMVQRKYMYVRLLVEHGLDINAQDHLGNYCLLQAVKDKSEQMIEYLLKKKANTNLRDISGRTCIHWAINFSNLDTDASNEIDNMLLNSGADLNAIDNRGRTPLHYAFVKIRSPFDTSNIDPIETVSNIISKPNVLIDVRDKYGNTPLNYAAQRGSVVSALYLIKNKADINNMNAENNTPLNEALFFKHQTLSIFLIHEKARLDLPVYTPNKLRTKEQDGDIIDKPKHQEVKLQAKKLVGKTGNLDEERNPDNQAEYESSESELDGSEKEPSVQEEAEESDENDDDGDDPSEDDNSSQSKARSPKAQSSNKQKTQKAVPEPEETGKSTFSIAIQHNCQSIAFLMIAYDYNLSLAILDCFNHRKFNYVYTLLLKKSQAGVYNIKNTLDQNLAHLFAKSASQIEENLFNKILTKMEENNLEFDLLDVYQKSPLHYAAECSSMKMIAILLNKGLNVNATESQGQTPLSIIAKRSLYKTEEFIQLARPFGLEIDKRFTHKDMEHTLMTYMMSEGLDFMTFSKLANMGANLNAPDSNGWTPLIYLIRQNREVDLRNYLATFPGVDLHVKDKLGRTVIHHAVKPRDIGSYENVSMLKMLAFKVNVNTPDASGRPPIYYAKAQGSGRMKQTLIDWGAKEYSEEPQIKRTTTAWLSEKSFPTQSYNFQEDFDAFVEECKEKAAAKTTITAEERCEVDHNAVGNYEVVYDEEDAFDAFMVKVDISKGFYSGNTFYKMQILREKVRDIYVLFTKWGRVGDDGQYQQTPFSTLEECKKEFSSVFKAKSGNPWENRHKFEKVDKKYRLVPFSKKTRFEQYLKAFNYRDPSLPNTNLAKAVFKFIRRICNSKVFSNALKFEFNIDETILPLQSLTRERLSDAQTILNSIEKAIQDYNDSKTKNDLNLITQFAEELTLLTSKYYELIPSTRFARQSIPPITNMHEVTQIKRMLNDLLYFEIAIKLLCGATFRMREIHPMDYIHCSMSAKIMSVDRKSEEYQIIE